MTPPSDALLTRDEFLEVMKGVTNRLDGIDQRLEGMDKTLRLIAKSQTWILEVLVTQDNQLTQSRLAELSQH